MNCLFFFFLLIFFDNILSVRNSEKYAMYNITQIQLIYFLWVARTEVEHLIYLAMKKKNRPSGKNITRANYAKILVRYCAWVRVDAPRDRKLRWH